MPKLLVTYNAYSEFKIPEGVFILSILMNDDAPEGAIGSWYIKHNTLHYIDRDGKEQTIDGSEPEVEAKRPEEIEEVDED